MGLRTWTPKTTLAFYSLLAIATAGMPTVATAANYTATLIRNAYGGENITELLLPNGELPVERTTKGFVARVSGKYSKPGYSLLITDPFGTQTAVRNESNTESFTVFIPVKKFVTPLTWKAVASWGESIEERMVLKVKVANGSTPSSSTDQAPSSTPSKPPALLNLSAGLGLTSYSFSETGKPNFSQLAVTPNVSYRYVIPQSRFELAARMSLTAFALASSPSGNTARTLEEELSIGMRFLEYPWKLLVFAGGAYSTMFVSDDTFGYSSLFYPQVYPTVTRRMNSRDTLGAYLKLLPLGSGLVNYNETAIALGLRWERLLHNGHPLTTSMDYSKLSFTLDDKDFVATSLNLTVSYGW